MAGWLDRWARRSASTAPPPAPRASAPTSRRAFLKRAAVVTGAAWTIPVLQSTVAPAYAASGGIGTPCSTFDEVCAADGSRCNGSVCGGLGAPCGALCFNSSCGSGSCGGVGADCTSNGQCNGRQCRGRTGGPTTCGGPGAACSTGSHCTHGNCNGATCGGFLSRCTGSTQCAASRTCFFGYCI